MFVEANHPKRWVSISVLTFLILTIPNSWLPELSEAEATNTLIAKEILENGDYFLTRLQGSPTSVPPLTAWLLSGIFKVLPVTEFTIRLVGITSLGLLTTLCGVISYRSAGPTGSAATIAATMSSYVAIKQGILGDENMLFCLLVNASWFAWYIFGREQRHWLYAWFFAHILVFLAILAVGIKAIFFFYFPLFFLRRPLNVWLRLRQVDHILSATVLCLSIILWIITTPYQIENVIRFFREFEHHEPSTNYLLQLFIFPISSLLSYTPWVFLAWPAYCVAFQPLEKDPILAQFLRTITFSLFFLFWLLPEVKPEILTPLIGPLSILVGLNYETLVRRYGRQLRYLPRSICWITLFGVGICCLIILPLKDFGEFLLLRYSLLLCITFLSLSIVMAVTILRARFNIRIWFAVIFSIVTFRLAFSSAYQGLCVYDKLSTNRTLGAHLSESLPIDIIVYEMITDKESFSTLSYYLNRPVTKINDVRSLPYHEDTVFVLGKDVVPISRNRNWFPVSESVAYDNYQLRMWKGEKRIIEVNPDHLEFRFDTAQNIFEEISQTVSISHGFSRAINVRIIPPHEGHLEILSRRETIIRPGEVFELKIGVTSEFVPKEKILERITIQFDVYKKNISRLIRIDIAPTTSL